MLLPDTDTDTMDTQYTEATATGKVETDSRDADIATGVRLCRYTDQGTGTDRSCTV